MKPPQQKQHPKTYDEGAEEEPLKTQINSTFHGFNQNILNVPTEKIIGVYSRTCVATSVTNKVK